jgi:hypothetical protein
MPEASEISRESNSDGFADIAALLADQIAASHKAAARCFSVANDEEDFGPAQRGDALRVASRLMHACAASANAIRRIKGGEFHHRISVERFDYTVEKAARKAREQKERQEREEKPSPGELMGRMMDASIANDLREMHKKLAERAEAKKTAT